MPTVSSRLELASQLQCWLSTHPIDGANGPSQRVIVDMKVANFEHSRVQVTPRQ